MRKRPQKRLEEIAEAAVAQFSETGFRRTQMAEVARRARVSAGTLYLYVESKEALLLLAFRRVSGTPIDGLDLPLKTPSPDDMMALVHETIERAAVWPVLNKALKKPHPNRKDFAAVGAELYDMLTEWRRAIRLLDRLAAELPDFDAVHADLVRGRYVDALTQLLEKTGSPRLRPELRFIARTANETMAWAAMHRRRERPLHGFAGLDEATAKEAALDCFAAVLATAWQQS